MEDFLRDILQTEHGEVKSKTGFFFEKSQLPLIGMDFVYFGTSQR